NMLAAYASLRSRAHAVRAGTPIEVTGAGGAAVMRIYPIASDHAPQVCRSHRWPCHISNCSADAPWTRTFEEQKLRDFCGGETFAYVIDLLDGAAVKFRIYYNDASPDAPRGVPTMSDGVPFDVAILCVAS